jgi:hypothetical protein
MIFVLESSQTKFLNMERWRVYVSTFQLIAASALRLQKK